MDSLYLVNDKYSLVSPGFVYGLCKAFPWKKSEDYCILLMETNMNVDSRKHLLDCKFSFSNWNETGCGGLFMRDVVAISRDKAVLLTELPDSSENALGILDFSDCKAAPVDIGENIRNEQIYLFPSLIAAPTHDTFAMILMTDTRSNKRYQAVIDFDGNIVSVRKLTIDCDFGNSVAIMHSTLNSRLFVRKIIVRYQYRIAIYRNYDNGTEEVIKEYPFRKIDVGYYQHASSMTNQHLTVCTKDYDTITCGHFDLNGHLKFEIQVEIPFEIYTMQTFNLRGGGFLFAIIECYGKKRTLYLRECLDAKKDVVLRKYDATGAFTGSLTIDQLPIYNSAPSKPISHFHFFENEEEEMCLSRSED